MSHIAQHDNTAVLGLRPRIPEHVVYRTFAESTVVLNLDVGMYHGLDPLGARILEALDRSPTVADAIAALCRQFDAPPSVIQADVCAFCADLEARGLVCLDAAGDD
jgi:Coenzyme PQQ synthesis protein D (PqqD)